MIPLRIVCLTHFYIEENRAGGELMLHALLSALASVGHDVKVLVTDTRKDNTTIDGVKVVYGASSWVSLSEHKYDIIISQFKNTTSAQGHAWMHGKPHVHVVHNDRDITLSAVNKARLSDLNVFNADWIQEKSKSTAPSVVVHPPVDPRSVSNATPGDREYVTLVNLTKDKGADIFYSLAAAMPDVKFLGVIGGYYKNIQVVKDLPNVTVIDNTPNMASDVYDRSKVVLMPSSYETYGMVAAEAIASGIPVIAAPTPGLLENLGDAGIFVERDPKLWLEKLSALLSDDELYSERVSAALKRHSEKNPIEEMANFVRAVEKAGYGQ